MLRFREPTQESEDGTLTDIRTSMNMKMESVTASINHVSADTRKSAVNSLLKHVTTCCVIGLEMSQPNL